MKPLFLILAILAGNLLRAQTLQIYFDNNSAEVHPHDKSAIIKWAQAHKLQPGKINISGFADSAGTSNAN